MTKFIRICGTLSIISGVLFLASWFSMPIFLWPEISSQNFSAMVQNSAWTPINVIVLSSCFLLLPGLVGIYLKQADK
ncbi:hypothetical protein ACFL2K_04935, partial [Candidatus Margulisiibacteriota bacterium]